MSDDIYAIPELYDALLPVGPACLAHYAGLAARGAGPVLEMACGTGQLAMPIATSGLAVTGIDRSPAMLGAARARAEAAGVALELIEGDMRELDLGRRFAFVFIARNSLLHLETTAELLAALAAARRHLAPDGLFAFDVFNPDVTILARPAGRRYPVMRVESERFGALAVESSHDYDAMTQVNRSRWHVSTPARPEAWTFPVHVRCIFPQELPLLVERAGFRLVSRHGDFEGAPLTAAAPRQVCVCRAA